LENILNNLNLVTVPTLRCKHIGLSSKTGIEIIKTDPKSPYLRIFLPREVGFEEYQVGFKDKRIKQDSQEVSIWAIARTIADKLKIDQSRVKERKTRQVTQETVHPILYIVREILAISHAGEITSEGLLPITNRSSILTMIISDCSDGDRGTCGAKFSRAGLLFVNGEGQMFLKMEPRSISLPQSMKGSNLLNKIIARAFNLIEEGKLPGGEKLLEAFCKELERLAYDLNKCQPTYKEIYKVVDHIKTKLSMTGNSGKDKVESPCIETEIPKEASGNCDISVDDIRDRYENAKREILNLVVGDKAKREEVSLVLLELLEMIGPAKVQACEELRKARANSEMIESLESSIQGLLDLENALAQAQKELDD